MKKTFLLITLLATQASAATFTFFGTTYGTVCRDGSKSSIYPTHQAQPVGSECQIRGLFKNVVGTGLITKE
jgi:hypothetical protein